jgi:hypothetical protein
MRGDRVAAIARGADTTLTVDDTGEIGLFELRGPALTLRNGWHGGPIPRGRPNLIG